MKEPDGWLIIGTKVDDTEFKKNIKTLEMKLKRFEKESEELTEVKVEHESKIEEIEKEIEAYQNLRNEYDETEKKLNFIREERKRLESEGINAKDFPAQYSAGMMDAYSEKMTELFGQMVNKQTPEVLTPQLEAEKSALDDINNKLMENEQHQAKINQELTENIEQTEKIKQVNQEVSDELKQIEIGQEKLNKGLSKVGQATSSIIRKVGRWAIAVIGVYSAYSFVRQAMNTIAQYDKQLATDLEYIRYAIAMTLKPVVEFIVKLVYKLLYYTGYLLKAWFGIDIFANSSADSFRKAKESLKSSAKSAKEIRKQLAGFDEMEILQDLNSNNNTGNDSGFVMPSYDLSKMQGDVPGWLKWLGDNRDWILALLGGIAGALIAIRLGASLIQALGIGVMIAGIITAIQGLLAYLDDPSWENFGKIIQGIGIFIIGLGIAFLGLPGIIAGVVVLILGTIIKYWNQIKEFLQGGIDWLVEKSDWIHEHFGDFIGGIYDLVVGWLQDILDFIDTTMTLFKDIFDNIIDLIKNVFTGNWKEAWENVKNIFADIIGELVEIFKLLIQPIVDIVDSIASWIFNPTKKIKGGTSSGAVNSAFRAKGGVFYPSKLPKLAMGGIINQPGKGVPYNGAIIGERGAEAVLPLTDSGQMALLGEAIGKYVNINATIPVYVGNRQVARTIRKIDAEDDFAFNK